MNESKAILITGGAGFIGSHLSEQLLKQNRNVIVLDNLNDFYDPRLKENNIVQIQKVANANSTEFKFYKGDIRNLDDLKNIFENHCIEGVVHLAANAGVRPSIENPLYYVDVNLIGLTNILECLKAYDIKPFVFASSSSVYGNNKKVPFSETDSVDNPISPYAATKKAGELLCYTYHHLYNVNVACMRYFTVYGPRQRPDLAINKFTRLMLDDKAIPMYGNGTTARDYTYVSDIVNGTIKALDYVAKSESKVYDIFNLGGSHPISLIDLINLIGDTLHKVPNITKFAMQPGDVEVTYSDYTHAKTVLNYVPEVNIDEGIEKFVNWYRDEKSSQV